MKFDITAPKGKGITHDKALRKVVIIAENVEEEKNLYDIVERIHWMKKEEFGPCLTCNESGLVDGKICRICKGAGAVLASVAKLRLSMLTPEKRETLGGNQQ